MSSIPRTVPQPAPRIVIAEPDDDTRLLYREHFRSASFEWIETSDGRDALLKCLVDPPALLITATHLPIIDGYTLCELLRRDPITQTLPILVVTTDTYRLALQRLRRLGVSAILLKPFSMDAIETHIERLCHATAHSPLTATPAPATGEARSKGPHSRPFERVETVTPPNAPPSLFCPLCQRPLVYRISRIGEGSSRWAEQWDEFACPAQCGSFEFRHRTKHLRQSR